MLIPWITTQAGLEWKVAKSENDAEIATFHSRPACVVIEWKVAKSENDAEI